MAGDWIKIEVSLPDKPEVWQISESLSLDADTVVGKLVRVFSWFDAHTENGNAPIVTERVIDRIAGVTGFSESLVETGWLVRRESEICLKNFERHNGSPAKTRAQGQRRQARHRNASSVTRASPEKRREEKKNNRASELESGKTKTRDHSLEQDLTDKTWAD